MKIYNFITSAAMFAGAAPAMAHVSPEPLMAHFVDHLIMILGIGAILMPPLAYAAFKRLKRQRG